MTRPKPARLTVPTDATPDEVREALRKLRQREQAATDQRERSGKPPRSDGADRRRVEQQDQRAAALGERIVPISEANIDCMDELVAQLANEITDD